MIIISHNKESIGVRDKLTKQAPPANQLQIGNNVAVHAVPTLIGMKYRVDVTGKKCLF